MMTYINRELCWLLDKGIEIHIIQFVDNFMGVKGKIVRKNTYNIVHKKLRNPFATNLLRLWCCP